MGTMCCSNEWRCWAELMDSVKIGTLRAYFSSEAITGAWSLSHAASFIIQSLKKRDEIYIEIVHTNNFNMATMAEEIAKATGWKFYKLHDRLGTCGGVISYPTKKPRILHVYSIHPRRFWIHVVLYRTFHFVKESRKWVFFYRLHLSL